jgi:hypothetical protein
MSQEQMKALLESCLYAFNEMPNNQLNGCDYPSTYALAGLKCVEAARRVRVFQLSFDALLSEPETLSLETVKSEVIMPVDEPKHIPIRM